MSSQPKSDKGIGGVRVVAKPNLLLPPDYTGKERRLGTPRRLRIVAIGAGASGTNLLHKLHQYTKNIEYVVYEKNVDGRRHMVQGIQSMAPAIRDLNIHITEFMKRTVWSTACRSWFKNGKIDDPVVALHPGSRIYWFHMIENPRI